MKRFDIVDLGIVDYLDAYRVQISKLNEVLNENSKETVYLLEHPPVYTLGRTSKLEEIKTVLNDSINYPKNISREPDTKDSFLINEIKAFWTNRGGGITYHGPGQIIIYPVINPKGKEKNLNAIFSFFEKFIMFILSKYNISSFTDPENRGVWTDKGKIASIGIGVKKWVLYHGISLNINCNLKNFSFINPCGIENCKVINLNDISKYKISVEEIKNLIDIEFNNFWIEYWKNI